MPERNFAEFETGNLTLNLMNAEAMGLRTTRARNADRPARRRRRGGEGSAPETRASKFPGEIFDTGVCHMAFFDDPDGNALMLHHRYAPRVTSQVRASFCRAAPLAARGSSRPPGAGAGADLLDQLAHLLLPARAESRAAGPHDHLKQ